MFGPRFYILSIGILLLTAIGVSAVPETVRLSNAIWTVDIVTHSLAVEARPIEAETVVPISVGQTGLGDIAEFSQEDNMAMKQKANRVFREPKLCVGAKYRSILANTSL